MADFSMYPTNSCTKFVDIRYRKLLHNAPVKSLYGQDSPFTSNMNKQYAYLSTDGSLIATLALSHATRSDHNRLQYNAGSQLFGLQLSSFECAADY